MEKHLSKLRLDGGALCLDFTNTIHDRTKEGSFDYLGSYQDVLKWCRHAGVLTAPVMKTLERLAKAYPPKADAVFRKTILLRALLFQLFSDQATGKTPDPMLVEQLNPYLAAAFEQLSLQHLSKKTPATLSFITPELDLPWWLVVKSAVDVLVSEQLLRVRRCPACYWLFIDKSKNRSRRWCNMATCGDLHKVKQFYERKKQTDK
ncbi:ABATE domain-containing protein [Chitinophaga horti]|uniref:ABATE domain-containing protein n=1 Tax=Chitinophaga horti TaxID=2920382 RepID=A0ABY6J5W4_9BACT|nr:ABATE domain-containing protein [Chitinophaga horti]UYQ95070.1 ABATE domain-containing protein [Chitinophaga horti]